MSYILTEFGADVLSDVTTFCEREVLKQAAEADRNRIWPEEMYEKACEMGLGALSVPEEYGGLGLTLPERAAILEKMAWFDAGFAVSYMTNILSSIPVFYFGEHAIRKSCYDLLLEGRFGAFCLTEDQAGSDISRLRTRAVRDGEEYIINGSKMFVTNGRIAGYYVVFAETDAGLTAFYVTADTPGIEAGEEENKLGIRNSDTCEVSFQDVRVPYTAILGKEGEGRKIAVFCLRHARIFCGVTALGVAQRALDESISRVREREQFGSLLADNEVIQFKLADMYMKTEAARQCCISALNKAGAGEDCRLAAATAKCLAGDAAEYCASEAVQIFGGYGYCEDYPVEKLLRDAKIFQIFEGTNEIQRLTVGRTLVK